MSDGEHRRLISSHEGSKLATTHPGCTVCGIHVRNSVWIFIIGLGSVLGLAGQQISLPLYLSTLEDAGGPYFVLWLCSFSFTVIFGLWSAVLGLLDTGNVTREMLSLHWHPLMFLVGAADALNGVLIVYSSSLDRTPGPMQAVLGLTVLPFTLVFSKFLAYKSYNWYQKGAAGLVFCGLLLCIVPQLHYAVTGEATFSSKTAWWWPMIYLLGQVPSAIMNVLQERLQIKFRIASKSFVKHEREFSVIYFQFIESFYQFAAMNAFFFFDLIPNYGISKNIDEFAANFRAGWHCMVNDGQADELSDRCQYDGAFALLFMFAYLMSYVFSTFATRHASANLLATATGTLPAIFVIVFWLAFPSVNHWGGGEDPTNWDIGFNIGALGLILPGIWMYHHYTRPSNDEEDASSAIQSADNSEPMELCFPKGCICSSREL